MALNKPTSKQLKGHFDALRVTRSHTTGETIDIAAGNYGPGKVFAGATEISDPSWVGATETFYIYLDTNDNLVLNDTVGFPRISTKIAIISIVSGEIIAIADERASINSAEDGYYVSFDDSNAFVAIGDNVQEAIESIDGYLNIIDDRLGTNVIKYKDIGLLSGTLNCAVKVTHTSWAQAIGFVKKEGVIGRVSYNISIPDDYVSGTDVFIKIFWSTPSAESGDMVWKINYRVLASFSDQVNSLGINTTYVQPAPGVDNRLVDTGSNIKVAASDIGSNPDLLIIRIDREGSVSDTFDEEVKMHMVRIEYTGRGIK